MKTKIVFAAILVTEMLCGCDYPSPPKDVPKDEFHAAAHVVAEFEYAGKKCKVVSVQQTPFPLRRGGSYWIVGKFVECDGQLGGVYLDGKTQ